MQKQKTKRTPQRHASTLQFLCLWVVGQLMIALPVAIGLNPQRSWFGIDELPILGAVIFVLGVAFVAYIQEYAMEKHSGLRFRHWALGHIGIALMLVSYFVLIYLMSDNVITNIFISVLLILLAMATVFAPLILQSTILNNTLPTNTADAMIIIYCVYNYFALIIILLIGSGELLSQSALIIAVPISLLLQGYLMHCIIKPRADYLLNQKHSQ
ncbi:MAG: hypothetical protein AAFV93_20985 [Chloroflexota bacterium]